MSFSDIIANVDEIFVAFELSNNLGNQGSEHGGIDNVSLPEPASLALLLMGAALFLCRKP